MTTTQRPSWFPQGPGEGSVLNEPGNTSYRFEIAVGDGDIRRRAIHRPRASVVACTRT
jgi:hypothetical protein